MRHRIDWEASIFHLDLAQSPSAQKALEDAVSILAQQPELWGWDWIVEALAVPEDASVSQISQLAGLYAAQPSARATTVLVSHDQNLHLWAKVMDFQFPGRQHLVVTDFGAAMPLIERMQTQRT